MTETGKTFLRCLLERRDHLRVDVGIERPDHADGRDVALELLVKTLAQILVDR